MRRNIPKNYSKIEIDSYRHSLLQEMSIMFGVANATIECNGISDDVIVRNIDNITAKEWALMATSKYRNYTSQEINTFREQFMQELSKHFTIEEANRESDNKSDTELVEDMRYHTPSSLVEFIITYLY